MWFDQSLMILISKAREPERHGIGCPCRLTVLCHWRAV